MTLPDATKDRVVLKYLLNIPRPQIAEEEDIGEGSVDNILKDFYSQFGSDRKRVKLLVEAMRRTNMSVKHHALAVKLFNTLVKFVSAEAPDDRPDLAQLEEITDLLEGFCNVCNSKLLDPVGVVHTAKRLDKMCAIYKVPPEELPATVETLLDKASEQAAIIDDQKMEIQKAEQIKSKAEHNRDEALLKHDVVFENVESYKKAKESVARYGLDLDEHIAAMAGYTADMEAEGLDPGYAIPKLKRKAEMEREDEEYKQKRLEQFEMNQRLDLLARQQAKMRADELRLLGKMHELDSTDDQIERLTDAVTKRAKLTGRPARLTFEDIIIAVEKSNEAAEKGKVATTDYKDKEPRKAAVADVGETASTGSSTSNPPSPSRPIITSGSMFAYRPTNDAYLRTPYRL